MQKFKVTYIRPMSGDSTILATIIEAPSAYAAKQIAESMLRGMRVLTAVATR